MLANIHIPSPALPRTRLLALLGCLVLLQACADSDRDSAEASVERALVAEPGERAPAPPAVQPDATGGIDATTGSDADEALKPPERVPSSGLEGDEVIEAVEEDGVSVVYGFNHDWGMHWADVGATLADYGLAEPWIAESPRLVSTAPVAADRLEARFESPRAEGVAWLDAEGVSWQVERAGRPSASMGWIWSGMGALDKDGGLAVHVEPASIRALHLDVEDQRLVVDRGQVVTRQEVGHRGVAMLHDIAELPSWLRGDVDLAIEEEVELPGDASLVDRANGQPVQVGETVWTADALHIVLGDDAQVAQLSFARPWARDAAGEYAFEPDYSRTGNPLVMYRVTRESSTRYRIATVVSGEWLRDEQRVWPVTVDPTSQWRDPEVATVRHGDWNEPFNQCVRRARTQHFLQPTALGGSAIMPRGSIIHGASIYQRNVNNDNRESDRFQRPNAYMYLRNTSQLDYGPWNGVDPMTNPWGFNSAFYPWVGGWGTPMWLGMAGRTSGTQSDNFFGTVCGKPLGGTCWLLRQGWWGQWDSEVLRAPHYASGDFFYTGNAIMVTSGHDAGWYSSTWFSAIFNPCDYARFDFRYCPNGRFCEIFSLTDASSIPSTGQGWPSYPRTRVWFTRPQDLPANVWRYRQTGATNSVPASGTSGSTGNGAVHSWSFTMPDGGGQALVDLGGSQCSNARLWVLDDNGNRECNTSPALTCPIPAQNPIRAVTQRLVAYHSERNSDGAAVDDFCPDGQVVTGFRGDRRTRWFATYHVSKLRANCSRVHIDEGSRTYWLEGMGQTPQRGDSGSTSSLNCPGGQVAVGVRTQMRTNNNQDRRGVTRFQAYCRPLAVTGTPGNLSVRPTGATTTISDFGGNHNDNNGISMCTGDEVMRGIRIRHRSGAQIHGAGSICGELGVTYGSPAPAPFLADLNGCGTIDLGNVPAGKTFFFKVDRVNRSALNSYGIRVRVIPPPPGPFDATATQGTHENLVRVTWTAAARADTYRVFRVGQATPICTVSATSPRTCDDLGAAIAGFPSAPPSVTATTDRSDGVQVAWTEPTNLGTPSTHTYYVVAENLGGESQSNNANGWRGVSLSHYEVSIGAGPFVSVGASGPWLDTSAPLASLLVGAVSASKGTSAAHVAVTMPSVTSIAGASRTYRVRAVNSHGRLGSIRSASGHRVAGPISQDLQRNNQTSNGGVFSTIATGVSGTVNDTGAPASGEWRWYQARATAPGAAAAVGPRDYGFRLTNPDVFTQAVPTSASPATFQGTVIAPGTPPATTAGFCYGTAPMPTDSTGTCVTAGAAGGAGSSFTASSGSLTPGTSYVVRAYLERDGTRFYGNDRTFLVLPSGDTSLANLEQVGAELHSIQWGWTDNTTWEDGWHVTTSGGGAVRETAASTTREGTGTPYAVWEDLGSAGANADGNIRVSRAARAVLGPNLDSPVFIGGLSPVAEGWSLIRSARVCGSATRDCGLVSSWTTASDIVLTGLSCDGEAPDWGDCTLDGRLRRASALNPHTARTGARLRMWTLDGDGNPVPGSEVILTENTCLSGTCANGIATHAERGYGTYTTSNIYWPAVAEGTFAVPDLEYGVTYRFGLTYYNGVGTPAEETTFELRIGCSLGPGICALGLQDTVLVATSPTATRPVLGNCAVNSGPERCDAIDWDCDGDPLNGFEATLTEEPCGICDSGRSVCAPDGTLACEDPLDPDLAGTECDDGVCGSILVCDPGGTPAFVCEAQLPSDNACGGCVTLPETVGDLCGDCERWACDGDSAVACEPSPSDFNACGFCDDREPGDPCSVGLLGACDLGELACAVGDLDCVQVTFPQPEQCDGLDNSCNGIVDDGARIATVEIETVEIGPSNPATCIISDVDPSGDDLPCARATVVIESNGTDDLPANSIIEIHVDVDGDKSIVITGEIGSVVPGSGGRLELDVCWSSNIATASALVTAVLLDPSSDPPCLGEDGIESDPFDTPLSFCGNERCDGYDNNGSGVIDDMPEACGNVVDLECLSLPDRLCSSDADCGVNGACNFGLGHCFVCAATTVEEEGGCTGDACEPPSPEEGAEYVPASREASAQPDVSGDRSSEPASRSAGQSGCAVPGTPPAGPAALLMIAAGLFVLRRRATP